MTQHTPSSGPDPDPDSGSAPDNTFHPAPGPASAYAPESPGRGLRRSGGWIFWIGLGLTLVAAAFAVVAAFMLIRVPAQAFDSAVHLGSGSSTTVELESGDTRLLLWDGGAQDACTVTSPSGSDALITGSPTGYGGHQPGGYGQYDYDHGGLVSASETGSYTVDCSAPGALLLDFGDLGQALNWGLGIAIAAVVGSLTGLLTVLGGVLWLVGRSQRINS